MPDRRTKGGHASGDMRVSELLARIPDVLFKPGAGTPQASAAVVEPEDAAPYVPTLRCPKCGHDDVRIAYCDSSPTLRPWSSVVRSHKDDYCGMHDPEHLHRSCRRCSYRWRTDDTLGRAAGD